ncbi:DUF4268 domain-containing protein [Alienimonas californiensis]|uniref:DUF4268 domain-containing protein n=1 Tax=Alienimonas californiensis TaxID=2527989 RepID=A0A517PAT2_9PLAN|nr:DUF4268 domain-containing protein [Alienimonas californiensis]QDT16483.1 hypothetical protein CA12_25870 [Alienimonas californiensis]
MPLYRIADDRFADVQPTTLAAAGIRERQDLQRFLKDRPDVLDGETLFLTEEASDWADSARRIDLLGLDRSGRMVVAELKRGDGSHMDLQAVRYAAMVSNMTFDRAVRLYADRRGQGPDDEDEARRGILEFLGWEEPDEEAFAHDVRIVLMSESFDREITTTALWLNERGIDVRCIELKAYVDPSGGTLLDVRQVIPLPSADDFLVREKEKREAVRKERGTPTAEQTRNRRFWACLIEHANAAGQFSDFHEGAKPRSDRTLMRTRCLPVSDAYIGYWFTKTGRNAGAHMGMSIGGNGGSHAVRSARLAARKTEIEATLGSELEHFDQDGAGRTSWIYTPVRGGNLEDESSWDELIPQMTDALDRFRRAVYPHLDALDPPEE